MNNIEKLFIVKQARFPSRYHYEDLAMALGAGGLGVGAAMAPEQILRAFPATVGAVGASGAGLALLTLLANITRQRNWMGKTDVTKFKTIPNYQLLDRAGPTVALGSASAGAGVGALAPELGMIDEKMWPFKKLF